jgi:Sulfotransferase domain
MRLMVGVAIAKHFALEHPDLMSMILDLEPLADLHPDIPKIGITHDSKPFWKRPHELSKSKESYQDGKVIFLARDPKDVVVSSYFHKSKRPPGKPHKSQEIYSGSLSAFIREEVGSLATLLEYYNIWAANQRTSKDFLLVRYEDMHENPKKELKRVLSFIGLNNVSEDIINAAVEFSSFDNMQRMEAEGNLSKRLQPGDVSDRESYKTRKGKVGGYVEYLTREDIDYINQKMQDCFSPASVELYGYLT